VTRRWQRPREAAGQADDWLMTYADMITLPLCFFVSFLGAAAARKNQAPVRQWIESLALALAPAQRVPATLMPLQPWLKLPEPVHPTVVADIEYIPPAAPGAAIRTLAAAADAPLEVTPPPDLADTPVKAAAPGAPASLPALVDDLKARHAAADIEQKGDRITTLEISSAAFFDSGSALLSDAGKAILRDVAVNLLSARFRGYQITVEGHTDDTPISTAQFPSNWELSTARASAVARFLLDQRIPAQRIRAAGYADTFPKAPNRDAQGNAIPLNQAQNRRVVIKLERID
jgi:chemotaxis protein MotB